MGAGLMCCSCIKMQASPYNISKAKGFLVCLSQEFAMPQSYSEFFYSYWTGLSRNGSGKAWLWMDGTPYSSEL